MDKRIVEIPLEHTQADVPEPSERARLPKRPPKISQPADLPEPSKRGKLPQRPPKKFDTAGGVHTALQDVEIPLEKYTGRRSRTC